MPDNRKEDRPCRILTRAQVLELVPLSYATIWALIRRGEFPRAIKITATRVGWKEPEIGAWIEARPRQALKGDSPEGGISSPTTQTTE